MMVMALLTSMTVMMTVMVLMMMMVRPLLQKRLPRPGLSLGPGPQLCLDISLVSLLTS